MAKLTKAEIKLAKEIRSMLDKTEPWTPEERERIFTDYNPAMDDNVTERGVFFTPLDLAMDTALFSYRHGHLIDCCGGIGGLTYSLLTRNYYDEGIKSITMVEFNPVFVAMAKRLLSPMSAHTYSRKPIKLHFVQGSVWDQKLWTSITSAITKFDSFVSNPPYGKASAEEKAEASWMHYRGERELMAVELAWRYSDQATMVIPPGSCEFRYSGRPYYERQTSTKVERFRKAMPPEFKMQMECEGIDGSVYRDQWKGTSITVEVADIQFEE